MVHINAGAAALALCIVLGKRKGWPSRPMPPHSLPLTLLGTGMLWFGWAGFNAGSYRSARDTPVRRLSGTSRRPTPPNCSNACTWPSIHDDSVMSVNAST